MGCENYHPRGSHGLLSRWAVCTLERSLHLGGHREELLEQPPLLRDEKASGSHGRRGLAADRTNPGTQRKGSDLTEHLFLARHCAKGVHVHPRAKM